MSIREKLEKVKAQEETLFLVILVGLVALGAYGLGRLSKLEADREPARIENAQIWAEE